MKIYIRSMAVISPLSAIEPNYTTFIDAKQIRRMSRIVKMGVTAALQCLRAAAVEKPDAIVTGTAYGCLEDTGTFLSQLIRQEEEALSPTAFIQSTHNTVGAQIALLLQCTGYNNTFVHRGFSFESALLDAMLLLEEGAADTVLVGGIDEITKTSQTILERFGLYRHGAVAGEGAAFFLLSAQASGEDPAQLEGLETFYKPGTVKEIEHKIGRFLSARSLTIDDIHLVLTGRNGDTREDRLYDELDKGIFQHKHTSGFKQLCGEYPTASAVALAAAAGDTTTGKILVYNNYLNIHHSLMLVSK